MKGFQQWIAVALLCAPALALAHHATDSEFDKNQALKLVGVISRVDWVNPHIHLYVDVPDENGHITTWTLESAPPAFWRKAGMTPAKFLGDYSKVTILCNPGRRDPSLNRALFQRLTRADGSTVQADAFVATPGAATGTATGAAPATGGTP